MSTFVTAARSPARPLARPRVSVLSNARARVGDARWDFLLVCVAGYVLCAVGRVHQLFSVLEMLHPAVLTGILAIALYLADGSENRRTRALIVPTTTVLFLFFFWMVLAVPTAIVISNSFDLAINNFTKTVVMFVVVAGTVRGRRDVERLMLAYLAGATIYAAIVLMRFDLGDGSGWRLGHLYYYDANDFATFAVTAMPFGLHVFLTARKTLHKLLAVGALGVLTLAFVRSGSRGGFFALSAVVLYIVLRYSAVPVRQRVVASVLVLLVAAGAASAKFWNEMGTILTPNDYNVSEDSGRLQIWQRGVGYMLSHPVFGVGANNFSTAEGTLSPLAQRQQFGFGVKWNAPHNSFVQVGAELGIPGLLLFLALLASAFAALRQLNKRAVATKARGHPQLAQPLTASLLGFVVGAFFLTLAYSEMLYTLLALVVALQKLDEASAGR
jgi:O-antigen ligase